jgi:dTDP-4-amino-4,6-dideoxygalactose transaminase
MIDTDDIRAVSKVLSSGHISQGEEVRLFESKLARFVGTRYAVAVSSGTSALHVALMGLNVRPGDEVIIPSYVCASPYLAVLHTGASPKIVDINADDFNINVDAAKEGMTRRTKAIVVPHMFGTPANLDELLDLGIPIVEDCAQSLGATYRKRRVGGIGRASICSFYATKMMTTGEGGMILTDDRVIYEIAIDVRDYDKKPLNTVRFNYKMTDVQAALGLSQLRNLGRFIGRRRRIASIYSRSFSKYDVALPNVAPHKAPVFYRYVVSIDGPERVRRRARSKGVICERPVWEPLHRYFPALRCPNADRAHNRALSIPIYPSLTEREVFYVVRQLSAIFKALAKGM